MDYAALFDAINRPTARRPETVVVDRPDWRQMTTPSAPGAFWLNVVLRASMTDADADRRIAETIEHYRALGLSFLWNVGENSRPRDLGERLVRAGLSFRKEALGMVLETEGVPLSLDGDVATETVHNGNVDDYVDLAMAGWENAPEQRAALSEDMHRAVREARADVQYFIARRHGQAAGTAFVRVVEALGGAVGYLVGGSVHPKHRSKGVYRALVAARAEWLRACNVEWMAVQAFSDTSAPICRRLGFRHVTTERSFQWLAPSVERGQR